MMEKQQEQSEYITTDFQYLNYFKAGSINFWTSIVVPGVICKVLGTCIVQYVYQYNVRKFACWLDSDYRIGYVVQNVKVENV